MPISWIVLLPPLLVVIIAAMTRRILAALLAGIFLGVLILHNFSPYAAVVDMIKRMWETTELGTISSVQTFLSASYLLSCLFLLLLGILITLIAVSGGAYAYGNFVTKRLKTAQQAEASSLLLSLFFFIDDYFSCLTVGSAMKSITDRYNIPRVKLAMLVNAMAAPLVVLVPVSSWVAQIMMNLGASGVSSTGQSGTLVIADLLSLYVHVIPFIFYAIMIIATVWFLVLGRFSFGLVRKHEHLATTSGNLFGGKQPLKQRAIELTDEQIKKSSMADFMIPLFLLVCTVFIGILINGDYYVFGGSKSLLQALQSAHIAAALFLGALVTIVLSFVFLLVRKKIQPNQVWGVCKEGIGLMQSSIMILILIWTLSNMLKGDLGTGKYLAQFLIGSIPLALMPVIFFLVAMLTATMMGSSWGCMGLLIPVGIPMVVSLSHVTVPVLVEQLPIIFPLIGAIISGAVVGNHLSPISDTILMSSTSTGAYHMDLLRTQFQLVFPTVFSTALSFLVAGFLVCHGWSTASTCLIALMFGLCCNAALIVVLSKQS